MAEQFISINLEEIVVGEPLPTSIYLYINFRFLTFRAEGDLIDRTTYDRLEFRKVKKLFIPEPDKPKFYNWAIKRAEAEQKVVLTEQDRAFAQVRDEVQEKTRDIFQSSHPDRVVAQTLTVSKKLVDEVLKFPFIVKPLATLQSYSKGTVDHSVNVSVLSVYLAQQMGYTHHLILQHLGSGALLHDLGKPKVPIEEGDSASVIEEKMKAHVDLGLAIVDAAAEKVPNEVRMIIAQHHEFNDGTGYPKKLKGHQIYDLARIAVIANVFDAIVSDEQGTLVERQRKAVRKIDEVLFKQFDPQKLEKALKILKLGV